MKNYFKILILIRFKTSLTSNDLVSTRLLTSAYCNENTYNQEHFPTKPVKTVFRVQLRVFHLQKKYFADCGGTFSCCEDHGHQAVTFHDSPSRAHWCVVIYWLPLGELGRVISHVIRLKLQRSKNIPFFVNCCRTLVGKVPPLPEGLQNTLKKSKPRKEI